MRHFTTPETAMGKHAQTNPTHTIPSPLVLTDRAVRKVRQLIDEEGNPDLKLRVFVQGGGCSGYQYGFTFDESIDEEGDTVIHFPVPDSGSTSLPAAEDSEHGEAEDEADIVTGFTLEKSADASRKDPDLDALRLLVDSVSYHYLVGAKIDYKVDIHGAQFVIKNPNATTTCGCGSSFSV